MVEEEEEEEVRRECRPNHSAKEEDRGEVVFRKVPSVKTSQRKHCLNLQPQQLMVNPRPQKPPPEPLRLHNNNVC